MGVNMEKYILNPLCSYNIESDETILIDTFLKAYRIKSSSQISLFKSILDNFSLPFEIDSIEVKYKEINAIVLKKFTDYLKQNKIIIQYSKKILDLDNEINISLINGFEPDTIRKSLEKKRIGIISNCDVSKLEDSLKSIGILECNCLYRELDTNGSDFYFEVSEFLTEDYDLVIMYFLSKEEYLLTHINTECYNNNKAWLPVYYEKEEVHIGPIIIPNETPCYNCLEKRRTENYSHSYDLIKNKNHEKMYTNIFTNQVLDIVAFEIYLYLSVIIQSNIIGKELVIDLFTHVSKYNNLFFYPNCEICEK